MIRLFRLALLAAAIALFLGGSPALMRRPPSSTRPMRWSWRRLLRRQRDQGPADGRRRRKTIAGLLTDKSIGVPSDHVSVLLSKTDEKFGAQEATKENILKAIGCGQEGGKEDTLLIYMVMRDCRREGLPLASDSTFKDRAKNAVFGPDFEEQSADLKSEQVAVFLDFNLKAYESKERFWPRT